MKIYLKLLIVFFVVAILGSVGCKDSNNTIDPTITQKKDSTNIPPKIKGKCIYVSATGSDSNTGLSINSPYKLINTGINAAVAGDTVYVMNGTYTNTVSTSKSGLPNGYILIKAYPGHAPKIYIYGEQWNAFLINGSYIVVDGIEIQGDNANLNYTDAMAAYNGALNNGIYQGKYNTNGLTIGGSGTSSKFPHHVIVRNCKIHDFPGAGLNACQADYITFENNICYNNAWYMMYGGSGISILCPFNSDAGNPNVYKNIVQNNICYGNFIQIPALKDNGRITDGNGIIIDVNQNGYSGTTDGMYGKYNGRTLVTNNVSFNNGGSGIHAYKADHVDIINNTTYGNGTKTGYANIFAGSSTDVRIINNIMYARNGGSCNSAPAAGTVVTFSYNIYYNGTVNVTGANDKTADPQFVNPSIDGAVANFSLNPGSPAINYGYNGFAPKFDILGVARPKGSAADCGAYEVQ